MNTGLFPQDSTLKRHAESAAFHKQMARLETAPTDSTLSRHYAQLKNTRLETRPPSRPATPEPALAQPVTTAEPEKRTGLLGLLGRLFGL